MWVKEQKLRYALMEASFLLLCMMIPGSSCYFKNFFFFTCSCISINAPKYYFWWFTFTYSYLYLGSYRLQIEERNIGIIK
ncbi:hypothetical protein F4775DRAFT_573272 [Biscogniauxia sp. FL1348]|nr:hypothetical protein F4775DRAFT_573272 [Biscogniauxia sp. FL1348]